MPKEIMFFKGKTKWFRPNQPNQWNKWEHVLYPDNKTLEIIQNLQKSTDTLEGIKNRLMKDDDGYYIRIGRKTKIEPRQGVPIPLFPPEVFDKDGKTPLKDVFVGNGSDITTKVDVYSYKVPTSGKRGRALRWESTRIDNLIPYESPNRMDKVPAHEEPEF